jgi:hypothetical protein
MKLRSLVWAIALCTLSAVALRAQGLPKTGLAGTAHDIAGTGCKGCHAPHNGSTANGGSANTGLILLWARSFPNSSNTFGVYDSATMNNKAVELGGSALSTSTDVRMYSLLCLSCHDGVTSSFSPSMNTRNQVGSRASFGGGAYESLGLTNDHPINISYDPTKDPALQAVGTVSSALPLFGSTNTLQCATCHDTHNNVNTKFLRQPNNTTHCTTCHL